MGYLPYSTIRVLDGRGFYMFPVVLSKPVFLDGRRFCIFPVVLSKPVVKLILIDV